MILTIDSSFAASPFCRSRAHGSGFEAISSRHFEIQFMENFSFQLERAYGSLRILALTP